MHVAKIESKNAEKAEKSQNQLARNNSNLEKFK